MSSTDVPQQPGIGSDKLKSVLSESSVRILCVGDVHLMDRPPVNCTDSYTDDILDMIRWIGKLANTIDARTVFAGDMFHHKQPSRTSHSLLVRAIKALEGFRDVPLCVTGNHDLSSDRIDSLEKQPLGVLYESGALEPLDGWHESLPVFGVPWKQRWEAPGAIQEAFSGWGRCSTPKEALAVTHAPIYPPSVADNVMFDLLPLPEVSKAFENSGNLYYGHIHEPHGVFEVDGVTYANMGALSRGSLHEYNLKRKIQISLWTPEHGFMPIDVPHKPAEEVFKLVQAQEKRETKMELDEFLESIGSATLDISSASSVIEYVKGLDVEQPVKDKSIELLEEAS